MLMGLQLETDRSDNFVTMMASRDKPLRMLFPMRKDICRHGRLRTSFTFFWIILLSPRSLRANLKTVWSSITSDTTVKASRNEFGLLLNSYFILNFIMLMINNIFTFIQACNMSLRNFRLNKNSSRNRRIMWRRSRKFIKA